MAGKSNKGRNKKGSQNSTTQPESNASSVPLSNDNANGPEFCIPNSNGVLAASESSIAQMDTNAKATDSDHQAKHGDLRLYPVIVKTHGGEKLKLQLNPGDSVMDVRQFLLDSPETCFCTCYDLLLHENDGSVHRLEDYYEISEVADITSGSCSLEMVPALYDDRSIRAHVYRTRELLSSPNFHSSLSTYFALQQEKTQAASAKTGVKIELPELDGLGFMENVTSCLFKLFASSSIEIKCVESIVFSSFNPPPSYRRLVGDLIYLDVVMLENTKFCITGTTRTFYVNSSTENTFDPRPCKTTFEATTLIGLFQKNSSKFKKAFREILERKASAHPFENIHSMLPPNSWLGMYPQPDHKRDTARAENALTLSYGSELIGMQRDWNEELQSCWEFPHTTPQERILRDRALYKVTSDFVDAAVTGAVGVVSRCIPPINPTDPECFHMHVHNNIFFSFAVDADVEELLKKGLSDDNTKIVSSGSVDGLLGKSTNNFLHGTGGIPNGGGCVTLRIEEHSSATSMAHEISAEMQLAENEQATYASANNDLKGTRAYQEADVPGLYNLAMAIIDYRGYRVVAQSILPGILQGDKSDSLLYGSVDNGKKICWNENFHAKVLEAAKRLHLKEHAVFDESGNVFKLAAPVECKGIVGSDDRHYILDLMRVTPRDANYTGPGSRFCILRPELITAFCQANDVQRLNQKAKSEERVHKVSGILDGDNINEMKITKENSMPVFSDTLANDVERLNQKAESGERVHKFSGFRDGDNINEMKITKENSIPVFSETSEINEDMHGLECGPSCDGNTELCEDILFNPNVFTDVKLSGNPEEIAADEEGVRKASLYLSEVVLPKFMQDLCNLEISPMDGKTLTEALHASGINVRYVGKVASGTKHLPHLWDLCVNEIVVRSAKHILKDVLRDTEDHNIGPAISHFFNCFFGNCQVAVQNSNNGILYRTHKKDQSGHHSQGNCRGQAISKSGISTQKNHSTYTSLSSERVWFDIVELAMLKYQFELPEDARLRVKKIAVIRNLCQKVGITVAARKFDLDAVKPFQTLDILNLQPVVKHSVPYCSKARELLEAGKTQMAEGTLNESYTLFLDAFSILQQVTGPMHRDVASCCRYLAMVLYHGGDIGGAIMHQHKELIINERCLGLDHPDTAHSYGNMALFYHGLNQTELALRYMSRALLLLSLSSGPNHPDVAATFINIAMMYQDIGKTQTALRYLQEALNTNEKLLGKDHIQTAVCYHALAITFNYMRAYKLSHQHEKKTYDILVKQLGIEDSRTRDSETWLNTFKMRELQLNAQKQKGQVLDAASTQKAIDILKANPDLIHAFQAAATSGNTGSTSLANKSLNSAIIGETALPPRGGRGVDERAARAAAEARKKVIARGLLIRPPHGGISIHSPQPVTRLFNVVDNLSGEEKLKGERKDGESEGQMPAGLGRGFSSLDVKKVKAKNRAEI